jgi:hypothetical protein
MSSFKRPQNPTDLPKLVPKPVRDYSQMSRQDVEKELHKKEAEVWTIENERYEILRQLNQHKRKFPDSIEVDCQRYVRDHPDDKVAKAFWNRYEDKGEQAKECFRETSRIRSYLTSIQDEDLQ